MIALLVWLGMELQFSWPWFAGAAVAATLFARQQYLVRNRGRDACFDAFLNNNWVGVAIWIGLLAAYAMG